MFGDMAPTGFGTVTMDLGVRLRRSFDMRFVSQNDTGNTLPADWAALTLDMPSLISALNDLTGEGGIAGASEIVPGLLDGTSTGKLWSGQPWGDWRPDAAILLGDFTAARHMVARAPQFADVPTFHYVPIEGVDLPPPLATDLWRVTRPVAMSNFGAEQIEKVTGSRPPMIYHGVDADVFHPVAGHDSKRGRPIVLPVTTGDVTLTSRADCKALWAAHFAVPLPGIRTERGDVPSRKWMLRTDRHMPRKRYNSLFRALAPVLHANPEAVLIIHCSAMDQGGNLSDTLTKIPGAHRFPSGDDKPEGWGLFDRPFAQVILTNAFGWPREALTALYNAADLYVSVSAEGFGLTIAEAIACGTPAVGIDYSAVPEVIGPAGRLVASSGLIDNEYDHFWAAVDERAFRDTVNDLLRRPVLLEELGRKGPRHIRSLFSWDTAADAFGNLLRGTTWQPSSPSKLSATTSLSPAQLVSGAAA